MGTKRGLMVMLIIIILCALIHLNRSYHDQQPKILCVVSKNATSEDCSALMLTFNCTVCQLLSDYIQNSSEYFTNNTMLIFTDGRHCLPPPSGGETVINITGVSNFTMKGLGKITYNPSEEGAIHSSSVIACSCHGEKRSGILFYKSNSIVLENLTIEDCGTKFVVQRPDNFPLVSALTFRESYMISRLLKYAWIEA